ncbi:hypothetical protein DFJ74DRAFT_51200, partial [Hyaloraphidium curvatum]
MACWSRLLGATDLVVGELIPKFHPGSSDTSHTQSDFEIVGELGARTHFIRTSPRHIAPNRNGRLRARRLHGRQAGVRGRCADPLRGVAGRRARQGRAAARAGRAARGRRRAGVVVLGVAARERRRRRRHRADALPRHGRERAHGRRAAAAQPRLPQGKGRRGRRVRQGKGRRGGRVRQGKGRRRPLVHPRRADFAGRPARRRRGAAGKPQGRCCQAARLAARLAFRDQAARGAGRAHPRLDRQGPRVAAQAAGLRAAQDRPGQVQLGRARQVRPEAPRPAHPLRRALPGARAEAPDRLQGPGARRGAAEAGRRRVQEVQPREGRAHLRQLVHRRRAGCPGRGRAVSPTGRQKPGWARTLVDTLDLRWVVDLIEVAGSTYLMYRRHHGRCVDRLPRERGSLICCCRPCPP